ncbi:MAG: pyridoxamine 5'-phosphate oxidase family protein [Candidatus Bathyarchaeota archaeon]|nr:pyridoxamine 5'-phosphate oxidase family protein [Candidatus Bathyarchaeota archaeon]
MKFHMRRLDREIKDQKALKQLLSHSQYLVLSMADGDEPYAVPLGYVYDEAENTVYFHCAKDGKKMEFLKRNPKVWGLVVLDEGVMEGACVNLYASAMFSGRVEWVSDISEKIRVMNLFAEKLSRDVEGVKLRIQKIFGGGEAALAGVVFAKIVVEELTGKRSTEMTAEKLLELTA